MLQRPVSSPCHYFWRYLHDPRGEMGVAVFFCMWLDILMSFLKFKFRTTIGSHFWDLLQKVLQQGLECLSVSQKRELKRALEILGRKKILLLLTMKLTPGRRGAGPSHTARGWQAGGERILPRHPHLPVPSLLYFLPAASYRPSRARLRKLVPLSVSSFSHEKNELLEWVRV